MTDETHGPDEHTESATDLTRRDFVALSVTAGIGLAAGDIVSAADEATPPKYQGLVERYYQVLSRDSGDKSSNAFRKPVSKTPATTKGMP